LASDKYSEIHYIDPMKTITASEANRQFSKLLREAGRGEEFVITSHGQPVVSVRKFDPAEAGETEAQKRQAAWLALLDRLRKQPAMDLPKMTRDEMYERD
jgi:prevent-host-death family protein